MGSAKTEQVVSEMKQPEHGSNVSPDPRGRSRKERHRVGQGPRHRVRGARTEVISNRNTPHISLKLYLEILLGCQLQAGKEGLRI